MATITGLTAERMREIEAASIVDGYIDSSGHLILSRYDGSQIDAGSALTSVPADALVKYLNPSGFSETTPPLSYPDGVSLMWIGDVESTADWPTFAGKWGTLHTINWSPAYSDGDTNQVWTRLHAGTITPEKWIRSGNGTGWGVWKKLALSDEVAAVDARVTTTNGNVTSVASRTTSLEGRATTLEGRATTNEGNITSLGTRVTTLEGMNYPVYAIQAGNGTVPSGTVTACGYGATPLSPANGYVRSTNRITVPSAGAYLMTYRYKFSGGVGTPRAFVELTLASLTSYMYTIAADTLTFLRGPVGDSEDISVLSGFVSLNAGAQIGMNAFQQSGLSRAIDGVLHIQRTA